MKPRSKLTTPQEILLLFMAADTDKIDPIRIMKGMFVFTQESLEEWIPKGENYAFIAYNYGPCSFDVYHDLEILESLGHICSIQVPGRSWRYYSSTSSGRKLVAQIKKTYEPDMIAFISRIRDFVTQLSFRRLLHIIYKHYPEYASQSIFQ